MFSGAQRLIARGAPFISRLGRTGISLAAVLALIVFIAVPTLILIPFRESLGVLNLLPLYLLLSLAIGLIFGLQIASLGAIVTFVVFDIFFIPPYYTLTIHSRDHLFTLVAYMVAALAAAHLMSGLHTRTREALRDAKRTNLLYELNRGLVREASEENLLNTIASSVVEVYGADGSRVLAPANGNSGFEVLASYPTDASQSFDRAFGSVATAALETGTPMGLGAGGLRISTPHGPRSKSKPLLHRVSSDVLWVPIATGERKLGLLEVQGRPRGGEFNEADQVLLTTFADQAALAIERTRLMTEAGKVDALQQSDALKSSLLSAVSHDLRTPLTAIKAAASGLLDDSVPWSDEDRHELLGTIDEEADRLTRMVSNLLDLSRIEAGVLKPDCDWHELNELIADVVLRLPGANERVTMNLEDSMPLAFIDYVKISQVVENLISNALKFSPQDLPVVVESRFLYRSFVVTVRDQGPGIDAASLPHIFDRFYRSERMVHTGGSGIGLSIAKGFVEAHHGSMDVLSEPGEGTTFTMRLPQEEPTQ